MSKSEWSNGARVRPRGCKLCYYSFLKPPVSWHTLISSQDSTQTFPKRWCLQPHSALSFSRLSRPSCWVSRTIYAVFMFKPLPIHQMSLHSHYTAVLCIPDIYLSPPFVTASQDILRWHQKAAKWPFLEGKVVSPKNVQWHTCKTMP